MVFKLVAVPAKGLLWDMPMRPGVDDSAHQDRAFYDRRYNTALSGAFTLEDLPAAWRKQAPQGQNYFYLVAKYEVSNLQWHVLSSFSESDSPRAPRVQDFSVLFFRIPIRLIAGFSCCVHIPLCSLKTIGDKPPVGACYRGILAAIRDMLRAASRPAASALNVLKTMREMRDKLSESFTQASTRQAEAELQAETARKATAEAQQSKLMAERAKAEGMLQAAQQLEEVVEVISGAAEQLSTQITQSSRGADEQSNRVHETATAMEEMNATVLEVAKNAQLAAGVSGNAQKQTIEGVQIVSTAVENIKSIHAARGHSQARPRLAQDAFSGASSFARCQRLLSLAL